jgi:hypothetical protein
VTGPADAHADPERADESGNRPRATLRRWSQPGPPAAALAVLGVGLQIVAFLLGFQAATGSPPELGWARLAAVLGLLASLGTLTLVARLVDQDWLDSTSTLLFMGFGAFVAGIVTFYLPSSTLGAAGGLFLYTATFLLYGTLVVGLLWLAAGIGYMADHDWWRPLLAAPVLIHTGAHAVLLIGLLVRAGTLAEAAAVLPLPTG